MGSASIVLGIAFVVFMAIGIPVAFVLGAAALVGLFFAPHGLVLLPGLPQQMYDALSSFNFLAIPLFIFAGALLSEGGVAKNLMDLASATIGRGRGGHGRVGHRVDDAVQRYFGLFVSRHRRHQQGLQSEPQGARLSGAVPRRSLRVRRMRRHAHSADQRSHPDRDRREHVDRRAVRRRHPSGDSERAGAHGLGASMSPGATAMATSPSRFP